MTKLADLKDGDCYISPIHGRPVVRAVNPPYGLPRIWAWSRLGSVYSKTEEANVYEKTDLTLIEHYSTHPTPTPLLPVAKKEPDNGVLLSEIVRRYELGMREERIVSYTNGKKYIRDRKASEAAAHGGRYMAGLDGAQFLVAQKEFTRLVKVKAAEARKAEKESVKVDRDTDYWNE